ncbi:MAG: hypothetical protein A2428_04095 [Bdellovibrionales bacterium RIFOXYC1_FULL_54_43]|nr:MAG: hypothetical protein A2428_04095 [Bdellovibrionales bacterium RIFOXYC1_FULL_54_43]OFZ81135.1 MAG: hypothetical protein A2603_07005 [Bdellovibrionales bacterium RIFOXYD1_FULL_55_31]
MEEDLVSNWLRRDAIRWRSGVFSGIFAGLISLGLAMLLSAFGGGDFWFPVKLAATPILGPVATDLAFRPGTLVLGFGLHEALSGFLGFLFSQFVRTNAPRPLLALGIVWGLFSWIFVWSLFLQSFAPIHAAGVSSGAAFLVCLVYGLSLGVTGSVDRMLRRRR